MNIFNWVHKTPGCIGGLAYSEMQCHLRQHLKHRMINQTSKHCAPPSLTKMVKYAAF